MKYKKNIKIVLRVNLYIFLFLILWGSVYKYNKDVNNIFILHHINIEGNNYVNNQRIYQSASINKSKSIFDYDIKNIKRNIEKIPFVKTAYISIKMPNKLEIKIIERVPIALILNNNKKFLIDYDNHLLPANSKSITNFPVPILDINNMKINKNNSIPIIKYLYTNYNSLYNNVSEILESNAKITIITDNKTKIFINPKMAINNINKLKKFEDSIYLIKNIDDHKYINLIYDNQIIVKEKVYS